MTIQNVDDYAGKSTSVLGNLLSCFAGEALQEVWLCTSFLHTLSIYFTGWNFATANLLMAGTYRGILAVGLAFTDLSKGVY